MSWDKPNLGDECKYDFIHTIPSKKLNSFTSKLLQTNEIRSKINRDRIKGNISKIVLKIPQYHNECYYVDASKVWFYYPFGNTLGVKNGHVAMVIDGHGDNFYQIQPLKNVSF